MLTSYNHAASPKGKEESEMQVPQFKGLTRSYGFDEISIAPGRVTINPDQTNPNIRQTIPANSQSDSCPLGVKILAILFLG